MMSNSAYYRVLLVMLSSTRCCIVYSLCICVHTCQLYLSSIPHESSFFFLLPVGLVVYL